MRPLMRSLGLLLTTLVVASACSAQTPAEEEGERAVLTSLAPVYKLTSRLLAGTGISVINIPDRPRSMSSQPTLFLRQAETMQELFESADAAVGISRVWSQDPLYLYARQANIRIVNIDAALPWSHERSGVALVNSPATGDTSYWFWTAISNVIRMNEIVAFDLKALYPDQAAAIETNLQEEKAELISLKAELEADMLDVSDPFVYALTDELVNMTNELGIFVDGYFIRQDIDWSEEDYANLTETLSSNAIPVVIHKWQPSEEIVAAIEAGGAELVVLDNLELIDTTLAEGLRSNGEALVSGFRSGSTGQP